MMSLAISPDGTWLAVGYGSGNTPDDGVLCVWDLRSFKPAVKPIQAHGWCVHAIAFLPDGTTLLTGGEDGKLKLWDTSNWHELTSRTTPWQAYTRSVEAVIRTPDGKLVITAGRDGTIKIWNLATRELLRTLEGHSSPIKSLVFDPHRNRLVSGAHDYTIRVWDLEENTSIDCLLGHEDRVMSLALSTDGTRLASASSDGTVRFWKQRLFAGGGVYPAYTNPEAWDMDVRRFAFSDDGTLLASGSAHIKPFVW